MKCDNCPASKTIKNSLGCNGDQLFNRWEIFKGDIAKMLKIEYEPKFQCRFSDLVEIEQQEKKQI